MIKKISIGVLLILLIGGVGFHYYQIIFGKTISKDGVIFIQTNSNMANLEKELTPFLPEKNHFTWLAKKKTFIRPKAGKYLLEKDMSLNDVINLLRSGNQTPVILSFNNRDTLEKLAGRVATQIEADSTTIIKAMLDSVFLKKNGFTRASANYLWARTSGGDLRFTVNGNAVGSPSMIIDPAGKVGIGTISPASKLEVDGGDIEVDDSASGLILRSPNGTRYRIQVDNSGNLTTTAV